VGCAAGSEFGKSCAENDYALADSNRAYEEKHGFVFLIYATGKNAEEILALGAHARRGAAHRGHGARGDLGAGLSKLVG
jgi:2-oxo-4-hydroxy-4-carboxy--5-ureidoimidazoline (OHCU) decarboxylase